MGAEMNFSPVETIKFSELSLQYSAQMIKTYWQFYLTTLSLFSPHYFRLLIYLLSCVDITVLVEVFYDMRMNLKHPFDPDNYHMVISGFRGWDSMSQYHVIPFLLWYRNVNSNSLISRKDLD